MPHRLVAVELWHAIAQELAREDVRTLLGVSRTFRAVALRILFNLTEIHVGSPSTGPTRREREEAAKGILERIPRDPQLAHAIVRLRVHAGDGALQGKSGWQRILLRALGCLAHLRSFEWICTPNSYIVLSKRVVGVLVQACPDIHTLTYSCSERDSASSSEVYRLRGLRSLTFTSQHMDDTLDSVLSANRSTLRALTLSVPVITDVSILELGSLTRLEVLKGFRDVLLEPILANGRQLETLVLYGQPHDFLVEPFQKNALPHLRTLRLVGVGPEIAQPLADFLLRSPRLRRLHIMDQAPAMSAPDWSPLFAALMKMRELETLGVDLLETVDGTSFTVPLPPIPATVRTLLVGGTNAIKFFEAPPPGVQYLHVTTYGYGVSLFVSKEAGLEMATAAFQGHPALRFASMDVWHHPYARGVDSHAEISKRSVAGPDYDWLVAAHES